MANDKVGLYDDVLETGASALSETKGFQCVRTNACACARTEAVGSIALRATAPIFKFRSIGTSDVRLEVIPRIAVGFLSFVLDAGDLGNGWVLTRASFLTMLAA